MMVLDPYPGFEGKYFSLPCRNVLPKPVQKPHPPMWMACTNRDTIKIAAQNGVGALAFSFLDPEEARLWADIYYGIIKSDACVPFGHAVNANIAMVSSFSVHHDRAEAVRRGHEGFEFFGYALNALVAHDTAPGRTHALGRFHARSRQPHRGGRSPRPSGSALMHPASARPMTCALISRLSGQRHRPGDLFAAGRAQPPRPHLRSARIVRRRSDARISRPKRRNARRARPRSSRPTSPRHSSERPG